MYRVATDAAYIGLGMRRTEKVRMRVCVAALAGSIHDLGTGSGEIENLRLIPARLDVCLACTVAALAGNALSAMLQR